MEEQFGLVKLDGKIMYDVCLCKDANEAMKNHVNPGSLYVGIAKRHTHRCGCGETCD